MAHVCNLSPQRTERQDKKKFEQSKESPLPYFTHEETEAKS
ncbi:rCG43282 [Rattus norvegicus]|uniref:RCG43282 n=1 Tax=Rattus norvegicus TaxID=10116 RepID=A6IVX6_RAT|nr:rCG43282 [Rattus norvegicus]